MENALKSYRDEHYQHRFSYWKSTNTAELTSPSFSSLASRSRKIGGEGDACNMQQRPLMSSYFRIDSKV